jgi:predicted aspartyl protease
MNFVRRAVVLLLGFVVLPYLMLFSGSAVADNNVTAEYKGAYVCSQGPTAIDLKIYTLPGQTKTTIVFAFGPTSSNRAPRSGTFLMQGAIPADGGRMELEPDSWLSRPPGYGMIGLSGYSSDGGVNFAGEVTGGTNCTTFSVQKVAVPPAAPADSSAVSDGREAVALVSDNGVLRVPVIINGSLALHFVVDSGASDVTIPADVVRTMIRSGTLDRSDILGTNRVRLADGSVKSSMIFRIRTLRVGHVILHNVPAGMTDANGELLLGQSFLGRFSSWSIDNRAATLYLLQ